MPERYTRRFHALIMDDPEATVGAVSRLRREGYLVHDVHTPFPVHGMAEAMGLAPSNVSAATLVGATVGVGFGLGLQVWTSVWDWPLNIGGKSDLALPALVPVTFELGILFAAFATVIGLVIRSRLAPKGATPKSQPHERASDDRFIILVEEADAAFDTKAFSTTAHALGVRELVEGFRVS